MFNIKSYRSRGSEKVKSQSSAKFKQSVISIKKSLVPFSATLV